MRERTVLGCGNRMRVGCDSCAAVTFYIGRRHKKASRNDNGRVFALQFAASAAERARDEHEYKYSISLISKALP